MAIGERGPPPANLQPINVPFFYISQFVVQTSYLEVALVCADTVPTIDPATNMPSTYTQSRPLAILKLSPQSAKLLAESLSKSISDYENEFGVLPISNSMPDH